MSKSDLGRDDYPLAENRPESVIGARSKKLEELTIDAVLNGNVDMEDLRITPRALLQQAQIARSVGRVELAANFERAAEMASIPQEKIMRIYELLRPGRVESKDSLLQEVEQLLQSYHAPLLSGFIQEAAQLYEKRGLFSKRF